LYKVYFYVVLYFIITIFTLKVFDLIWHLTILAGHKLLKPEVICEPEITITTRSDDDECLILASDGLWDVISNKVACDVARQCLEDGSPTRARTAESGEAGPSSSGAPVAQQPEPRCYRAAALLARLALGRESSDNISVVVIDLKARG
jgi:protein phosphatase 2C